MRQNKSAILSLLFVVMTTTLAMGEVKLPAVLTDHMVVQRDVPVLIWGWDDAGAEVTVSLGDQVAKAKADADGRLSLIHI